jgi:hypothetical protein
MADPTTSIDAVAFETRVERVAGPEVADRVRRLDRWLEERGAHIDAFLKSTMVSMFAWWPYDVPGQRLPVIWPLSIRIEGVGAERVMLRIVFQELRFRPPFDDVAVRRAFLDELLPAGFDPRANLGGKPGLDLADLDDQRAAALERALDWFLDTAGLG